jgi:hypothetical protein
MKIKAGGTVSIIVVFLSLNEKAKKLGDENKTHACDKAVNRIERRRFLPGKVSVPGDEEFDDQQNYKEQVKKQSHSSAAFF